MITAGTKCGAIRIHNIPHGTCIAFNAEDIGCYECIVAPPRVIQARDQQAAERPLGMTGRRMHDGRDPNFQSQTGYLKGYIAQLQDL